ncbi:MAG: ATP synthase subunit I [Cetobacterium sp.]|uniref:ATP synthase subunit I n=1 Tax=unclassified Cetobacterium TaxID=2630983 RepID=UPI00064552CE|nr:MULTISPECIES: ATP synthase subunit I [unclassified Cetobacterium]
MVIAFVGGIVLGFLFFYSLDFGVNESKRFKNPSLFIFITSLVRIIILLGGFYFLAQNNGYNFFAALIGALVSRIYIVYFYKNKRK